MRFIPHTDEDVERMLEACGYASVRLFTEAMKRSEGDHLMAMVGNVQYHRLDLALRNHDWAAFAHGYNGPGFRENKYDEKLEKAWRKHAEGRPSLSAKQTQAALNRAGARPRLTEDGMIGPKTRRAIRAFQRERAIRVTGSAGPETIEALIAL